jgi:hypothetical protein
MISEHHSRGRLPPAIMRIDYALQAVDSVARCGSRRRVASSLCMCAVADCRLVHSESCAEKQCVTVRARARPFQMRTHTVLSKRQVAQQHLAPWLIQPHSEMRAR